MALLLAAAYASVAVAASWVAPLSPVHSAPVWPAAGVALGALLIWGPRVWPGVLLGAFLAYHYLGVDPTRAALGQTFVFACAATAQAALGAWWSRSLLAAPQPLTHERDVVQLLLYGGPLACLCAGALGLLALRVSGLQSHADAATWLLAWWAGNSIGVLLFAPLVLILFRRSAPFARQWGARVALPLLVTAGLLAAGNVALDRIEEANAREVTDQLKVDAYEAGFIHLPRAIASLRSVERFFAATEQVTLAEFTIFTEAARRTPGLLAVEWVPRVTAAERERFEARGDGGSEVGFPITEYDATGAQVTATSRAEYFPAYLVSPLAGNETTLGFDFGSNPLRRAAMDQARDSASAVAAQPAPLIQTGRPGFSVFVAAYRWGFDARATDVSQRRDALRGFVLGAFDIERLVAPLAAAARARQLDFRILDVTPGYAAEPILGTPPPAAARQWHRDLSFAGRTLRVELHSAVPYWTPGASPQFWMSRVVSLVAAFLVALSTLGAAGRAAATTAEVERRTGELRASEENLDVTLHCIGDAVLVTDTQGQITRINPVAEALTGWSQADALQRPVAEVFRIVHEQTREPVEVPVDRVLASGAMQGPVNHTVLIARDGAQHAIADSAAPIFGPRGGLLGVVLVFRDVEDERRAERALQASERRYRDLIERAPQGVFVQCEGRFAFLNHKAVKLLGARREADLVGQSVLSFLHPEGRDAARERIRRLNEESCAVPTLAERWLRVDGSEFYGEVAAVPYVHEDRPGALVFFHDISERIAAERERDRLAAQQQALVDELSEARAAADQASRAKSAFLAAMSHEIRTPMNGVMGMVDVLAHGNLSQHQAELVKTVRDSAAALLRIIDDILDFSKIEAGRLDLEREPVALADVIESLCTSLVPVAARDGVELLLFVSPAVPLHVLGDETRLRQVCYNLIGNAIKFSARLDDRGGRVSVRVEVDEGDRTNLVMRVQDNGVGMTRETVGKLFHVFSQGEVSTTRRFGDTGLGLVICKRLVELMGGEIEVSSTPDAGSTFTVHLPLEAAPVQPRNATPPLSALDCIVVQASSPMNEDLAAYLEHVGARLHRVADLPAAALAAARLPGPVVMLHDIGRRQELIDELPLTFSGTPDVRFVLVARGRRRRARVHSPNLVLLDGDALRRQALLRAVAIAAGRASPEIIHEDVDQLHGGRVRTAPSVAVARERGQLVLVAEDDAINQKVIRQQLALLGYAMEVASNGVEALQMWREGDYALLVTDLHMPQMDGYDLAAAIRAEERGERRMPIVALTANALRGEELRALALGIDAYVTKPASIEMLRGMLERWVGEVADDPAADFTPAADGAGDPDDDPYAVLSVERLQSLVGDDPAIVREFLEDYRIQAGVLADELCGAAEAGSVEVVASVAHRLKSSSQAVGAMKFAEICSTLEEAARSGEPSRVTEMLTTFTSTRRELAGSIADVLCQREA